MKTAILKIEVPDDFEKEDCEKCALSEFVYALCPFDNCPLELEIEEDIPMEYFENGGNIDQ